MNLKIKYLTIKWRWDNDDVFNVEQQKPILSYTQDKINILYLYNKRKMNEFIIRNFMTNYSEKWNLSHNYQC